MRSRLLIRVALPAFLLLAGGQVLGDIIPPVQIQIAEREPGAFLVQWRTPKILPVQAVPEIVMPEGCLPRGERVHLDQPGGWLNRQVYHCPDGLAGKTVGIEYPLHNPSLTSVIRVELLSGERFAHSLEPQERSWQIPESRAGGAAVWLREARSLVLTGMRQVAGRRVHLAFLTSLLLLGAAAGSVRWVTAFGAGQLLSLIVAPGLGYAFPQTTAEICVGLAVVFLAREALGPETRRWRIDGLAAGAGLFHGLALATLLPVGTESGSVPKLLALILGMDAALLVPTLVVLSLAGWAPPGRTWTSLRRGTAYLVGAAAVAAILTLVLVHPVAPRPETVRNQLPLVGASSTSSLPGSRRLGPQAGDAAIQSFLAVEPFEVRNEVLFRLRDLADAIGLEDARLDIDRQEGVVRRISDLAARSARVEIDGGPVEGFVDRAGFMTADPTGVWPRLTPEIEVVAEAYVGVTVVYLTEGMPAEVQLTWREFPDSVAAIPATIIDPETTVAAVLKTDVPTLAWRNQLLENPLPTLAGIGVEPVRFPLPLLSVLMVGLAAVLVGFALWGRKRGLGLAVARVCLALALAFGTTAQVSVAVPQAFGSSISEGGARRVLAGILPLVYRAFEVRDETTAYDRLALAVTGETLTDIYLEHRQSLVMEEQGGARARVDAVEVQLVEEVERRADGGFTADATWTVGGTVTHFGHRHFRQNRYDARVAVVPVDGLWKIRSLEVLDQERLK